MLRLVNFVHNIQRMYVKIRDMIEITPTLSIEESEINIREIYVKIWA